MCTERKKSFCGTLIILATLLIPAFAEVPEYTWDVPWWAGSQGNPFSSDSGDQWAVYQIGNSSSTSDGVEDWDNYHLMEWDNETSRWQGPYPATVPTEFSVHYKQENGLQMQVFGDGEDQSSRFSKIGAMVFTAPEDGGYSLYGDIFAQTWNNAPSVRVTVGYFDDSNDWHVVYNTSIANANSVSLDNIAHAYLKQGEKLVIAARAYYWHFGAIYFQRSAYKQVGVAYYPDSIAVWDDNEGNPYVDSSGASWGAYSLAGTITDWSNYSIMSWDTTDQQWEGASLYANCPYYNSVSKAFSAAGHGGDRQYLSALVYTAPDTGGYSIRGDVYAQEWINSNKMELAIGYFDNSDNWFWLDNENISHDTYIELDSLLKYQGFTLEAGNKLVLAIRAWNWNVGSIMFARAGYQPVSIINHSRQTVECGDIGILYYKGDLNKDCREDIKDLELIVQDWLEDMRP